MRDPGVTGVRGLEGTPAHRAGAAESDPTTAPHPCSSGQPYGPEERRDRGRLSDGVGPVDSGCGVGGVEDPRAQERKEKVRDPRGVLAPDARSARCQGASKRLTGL